LLNKIPSKDEKGLLINRVQELINLLKLDVGEVYDYQEKKQIDEKTKEVDTKSVKKIKEIYYIFNKISCFNREEENNKSTIESVYKHIDVIVGMISKYERMVKKPNLKESVDKKINESLEKIDDLVGQNDLPLTLKGIVNEKHAKIIKLLESSDFKKEQILNNLEEIKASINKEFLEHNSKAEDQAIIVENSIDKYESFPNILSFCYKYYDIINLNEISQKIGMMTSSDCSSPYVFLQGFLEIGECVNNITYLFQKDNPEIPYVLLKNLRNEIFHNYMDSMKGLEELNKILTNNSEHFIENLPFCLKELTQIKKIIDDVINKNNNELPSIAEYKLLDDKKNAIRANSDKNENYKYLYKFKSQIPAGVLLDAKDKLLQYNEAIFRLNVIVNHLEELETPSGSDNIEFFYKLKLNICGEILKILKNISVFSNSTDPETNHIIDELIVVRGNLAHDIVLREIKVNKDTFDIFCENIEKFKSILDNLSTTYDKEKEYRSNKTLESKFNKICNGIDDYYSGTFNMLLQLKKDDFEMDSLFGKTIKDTFTNIGNFYKALSIYKDQINAPEKIKDLKKDLSILVSQMGDNKKYFNHEERLKTINNKTSVSLDSEDKHNNLLEKLKKLRRISRN